MVCTTWVQFIKGTLLVVFCAILTVMILNRGIGKNVSMSEPVRLVDGREVAWIAPSVSGVVSQVPPKAGLVFGLSDERTDTGPLGPFEYIRSLAGATLVTWEKDKQAADIWEADSLEAEQRLLPGGSPTFKGVRSPRWIDRLDFVSLMLALFAGTASLPHILIRYYTVKDAAAARKSTVVGIGAIGFFYVLTLYIGLGAMVSGNLNPADANMSAPLLAQSFNEFLFAVISAIAFTTVLGTVSGLILAAAGAVAHDLMKNVFAMEMTDRGQVVAAKWASVGVGVVAMLLGILFKDFNAAFLVGWAFNVAASANLPALVMLLFWRGTTRQGIVASILVGLFASLGWLMCSAPAYQNIYGLDPARALVPFSQPALVTIPLAFAVLVIVSLATRRHEDRRGFEVVR